MKCKRSKKTKMNQTSSKIEQASNRQRRQQLDKGPSGNKAMRVPSQPMDKTIRSPDIFLDRHHLARFVPHVPLATCRVACVQMCPLFLFLVWPSACGAILRRRSGAQAWHLVHTKALHEPSVAWGPLCHCNHCTFV